MCRLFLVNQLGRFCPGRFHCHHRHPSIRYPGGHISNTFARSPLTGTTRATRTVVALATIGAVALSGLLLASPAQAATPAVRVSTAAQLKTALASATAGQTITLADGTYSGTFTLATNGTSGNPITLTGSRKAILTSGSKSSGYGLHVTGDYVTLAGFSVTNSGKGIVLDGSSNSTIAGVDVGTIGSEGIHVRTSSSNVVVRDSIVHDTGLVKPGSGEGIYIGSSVNNWSTIMGSATKADASNNVLVQNNTLRNTAAEGIDIKEGTSGGRYLNNTFDHAGFSGANNADSWIDVKGNNNTLTGNTGNDAAQDAIQVHDVLTGWGRNNTFSATTITGTVPGYEINLAVSASNNNTITCKTTVAKAGLTNRTCT